VPFRARCNADKPLIVSSQTAIVTGPQTEEIHTEPPVDPAAGDAASESLEADESSESEAGETAKTESEDRADPETDSDQPLEEESEPEDIGAEPEEAPPAAPALAGMVIPTPGNFI
jgi:hypothetical protein